MELDLRFGVESDLPPEQLAQEIEDWLASRRIRVLTKEAGQRTRPFDLRAVNVATREQVTRRVVAADRAAAAEQLAADEPDLVVADPIPSRPEPIPGPTAPPGT
jgi:hypothetical protein